MTTTTTIDVTTIDPIGHREAMELQTTEFRRAITLLRSLGPDDWSTPTVCPDWDVRRMWLHVLGASEAGASVRENVHQMRAARKRRKDLGVPLEAGLSGVQVAERDDLSPEGLLDRFEGIAPATVKGRTRTPRLLRAVKIPVDAPIAERWSLGYLVDVIYLRDAWMHRIDTARATGRELEVTPEHDGRIVADIVAEWARRHGEPFTLELTGPAGGSFSTPDGRNADARGGDSGGAGSRHTIVMDAVEFCWVLAGRGEGTGLLATIVPF